MEFKPKTPELGQNANEKIGRKIEDLMNASDYKVIVENKDMTSFPYKVFAFGKTWKAVEENIGIDLVGYTYDEEK